MRLSVLLLLLLAYVSSGRSETRAGPRRRAERTPSREGFAKRLAEFSAVPLNRISKHVTSRISALDARLTIMNLNVPVLSASSSEASSSSESISYSSPEPQEAIIKPSQSPVPGVVVDVEETPVATASPNFPLDSPSAILSESLSSNEPLLVPTATPNTLVQPTEPEIISIDEPNEASDSAASSTSEPNSAATRFRKFNLDGSLSAVFASQTPTALQSPDPIQEHETSENAFSATTPETEVDVLPEETEAVYDGDDVMESAAEEGSRLRSSAEPELTPLPAQNEAKLDNEMPMKYSEAAEEEDGRDSHNAKPRLSVSAFGPATASAVWTLGQPPDISFSSSSDTEKGGQNPAENESNTQTASNSDNEQSSDSFKETEEEQIESSPEQEADDLGQSEGFGRQLPKSPVKPEESGDSPAPVTAVSQGAAATFDVATEPRGRGRKTETLTDSEEDSGHAHISPNVSMDLSFSNFKETPTNQIVGGDTVPSAGYEDSVIELAFPDLDKLEQDLEVDDVQASVTEAPEGYTSSEVQSDDMELMYPDQSEEPAASAELLSPSMETELLSVALIVRHPPSYNSEKLAEDIRINSNEFIAPDDWEIASLLLLSKLAKSFQRDLYTRQVQTNPDMDELVAFELLLEAECSSARAACVSRTDKYEAFIRSGRMDAALATHDFTRVSVFLQGEVKERSEPLAAIGPSGLGVGVIAGIAVGAVAAVSLIILVVVVMTNRGSGSSGYNASDYSDSDLECEDDVEQENEFVQNGESFMVSNFGGTPRTTFANIPWLNQTSAQSGQQTGSQSFISVDSMMTNDNNTMSQYRFDETTSSSSKSDLDDLENPADIPVSAEGPDASGSTVYIVQ
ncbi:hypothetical protein BWQ96_00056 [Gracilariopsis chorda]|uniref:Uncharacterized protein n=1 Tax=Gracilariopsis chorda TaxID=448386 RepID=A0A2V3J643_9FLOR|nr:hypothetical protein BWQ96_00056 [Gracilariopsis chorda]|eukprot:PXF49896.1 hypothetical protein BWQ96_00056 [Gracilariopsis chorda]